jgi:hypothetical protein
LRCFDSTRKLAWLIIWNGGSTILLEKCKVNNNNFFTYKHTWGELKRYMEEHFILTSKYARALQWVKKFYLSWLTPSIGCYMGFGGEG